MVDRRYKAKMLLRARSIVTMDGPPIENGAVAIAGERITGVGFLAEMRAHHGGEEIDLGERILLPGLVNAHCHLDYTCLRGKISRQASFTDWIRAINAAKARLTQDDYIASITAGFEEARRFGTTSLVNLTAIPALAARVAPTVRTWWMAELIDVRNRGQAGELARSARSSLVRAENAGLSPHAPYTASPQLYSLCQEMPGLCTTHLAESREEMQMFRDGEGPLFEFIRSIDASFAAPGQTPLAYFFEKLDRGKPWLLAHMNELTEDDFALLKKQAPSLTIVHCPRSHAYFRHSPFSFARVRSLGIPVALGTDSLASNEDLNLFAEMRAFQAGAPSVPPEEIVAMATRAAGLEGVGRIAPGAFADLIALPFGESRKNVFEAIVAFLGEPVPIINGIIGTI